MKHVLALGMLALTSAVCTAGDVILSNYPGNDATGTLITASGGSKAMGFQLFEVPILIQYEFTLRLEVYDSIAAPRVEIFDDDGMKPGESVSVLDGPGNYSLGIGDYTFTHLGDLPYPQDDTYWLVVSSSVGAFTWLASDPPQAPWSDFGVQHVGAVWGTYPPSEPSSILSTYYLEAWYPAPGSLPGLAVGGLALRRRR